MANDVTLAVIPAHREVMSRGFSVDRRNRFLGALAGRTGMRIVAPDGTLTRDGLVADEREAAVTAELFEREKPEGIVLAVLGYGDEKSALAIVERFPGVPVLLFACREPVPDGGFLEGASVGGMLPISYGLHKRNIPFTFAGVFDPEDPRLLAEVESFAAICRCVRRFRRARVGMIGFRPYDFEVCMFNEALLLERYGVKTVPLNLIDLEHDMAGIPDTEPRIAAIVREIRSDYSPSCADSDLARLARLEVAMLRYVELYRLDALTIQCWSAIQDHIGVTPCLTNGRISRLGIPVACEGDAMGALTLLLQAWLGGGTPWLADVLMLHPTEKDLILAWHCGNAPASLAAPGCSPQLRGQCSYPDGTSSALAASELALRPGVVSLNRLVEHHGEYRLLHVDGEVVQRPDRMRGAWGWVRVADREKLLATMVEEGFVHHVSVVHDGLASRVRETAKYLGMMLVTI